MIINHAGPSGLALPSAAMTPDPRMPGPLVEPYYLCLCLRMLPAALAAQCPSIEAARRIAERVNLAWRHAWDDELRSAPAAQKVYPDPFCAFRKYAKPAKLSAPVAKRPEDMERSMWFDGTLPPWEPGVYQREVIGALRSPEDAWFARWTGSEWLIGYPDIEKAAKVEPGPPVTQLSPVTRWRGISEAQARALGLVRA